MLQLIPPGALSPADAPAPSLGNVIDPPLPPVADKKSPSDPGPAGGGSNPSGQPPANAVNAFLCLFMAMLSLVCLSYQ